jgi:hypothetical protein
MLKARAEGTVLRITVGLADGASEARNFALRSGRTASLPDLPVLFSTYLKTAETGGYVTLARDVDLRTLARDDDIAAKIPECR